MKKYEIVKDVFENYGSVEIETEFIGDSLRNDKKLLKILKKLYIKYEEPKKFSWSGMPIKYFGPFCCLKELILKHLYSMSTKEDLEYLENNFKKGDLS